MITALPTPVVRYLQTLETRLKAKSGVVPEEALEDARTHLTRHYHELRSDDPSLDDDAIYARLIASFGSPEEVAEQCEDSAQPLLFPLPGYAPEWRIACPRCGRSAPMSRAGAIRIGARSIGKRTFAWCRDCRWFRWFRVTRDRSRVNLTRSLGVRATAEDLRGP